jgi:hypothetical protein
METVDSRRGSAVSVVSLSTNSSGVSQVYSDLEHGRNIGSAERTGSDSQQSTGDDNKTRRRREFKARHIQMMGLGIPGFTFLICEGASIGTGLFYSSAKVLYFAGPIPACLAFLLMGTVVYSVLVDPKKQTSRLIQKDLLWRNGVFSSSSWRIFCLGQPDFKSSTGMAPAYDVQWS